MKLDLSEIATHLGKRIRYEINEPPIDDDESGLKGADRVTGEITFSNAGKHIVARGSFATSVELECARCLTNYKIKVASPIEEEFELPNNLLEVVEEAEEEELPELEREPLFEESILDLTELLRQNILLAVPIKPICDEACKGLCPHCGKNLNEGPCECPQEEVNPAFASLETLIKKEDEGKLES